MTNNRQWQVYYYETKNKFNTYNGYREQEDLEEALEEEMLERENG